MTRPPNEGPSSGPRAGTGPHHPGRPRLPRVHTPETPATTPEDGAGPRTPEDGARPLTRET